MRLLHTSDWHLGRSFHREGMLAHQASYVDHLLEVVAAERVDVVVVSGDVYDRALPQVDAVRLAAARPGSGLTAGTRALYASLASAAGRTPAELARAVAAWRQGGLEGLAVLEELDGDQLGDSPLLPSVRGDLLERAGAHADAAAAFTEAAARSRNAAERAVLQRRADQNLGRVSKSG